MYLKQKYEVFSLVVGATAVNSLDWEQNQTHYFHIENCWYLIVNLKKKVTVCSTARVKNQEFHPEMLIQLPQKVFAGKFFWIFFDQKEICEGGYIEQAIEHLYPLQENMIFVGVTPRGYPGHARGMPLQE